MANKIFALRVNLAAEAMRLLCVQAHDWASGFMKKICFTWHAGMGNFRKK